MNLRERAGLWVFGRLARAGSIELELPDGRRERFGDGDPIADLAVRDFGALRGIIRTGLTGFAEAYMVGDIETSDLRGLLRWGVANQTSWFEHPLARFTLPARRIWQRVRPERRHPRVLSMGDHYNLGNTFYEEWLDETMTYSSAKYANPDQDLADAQRNKYRAIADRAGLRPGMRVLEIGCGWGGFSEYAAGQRGCHVKAITLSEEQAAYAKRRLADAGLADRVDITVQDFRDVDGAFDAIVSIEMIESVDETHWPDLFRVIEGRLGPDARAVMQIITIEDDEWERYRSRTDFIQQYIFPGGQIPAPKVIYELASTTGLDVEQRETFGLDYAKTLATWYTRFHAAWPKISAEHQLDDRFRRMWDLYLTLCEAGFRIGRTDVEHWVFSRFQVGSGFART